MKLNEIAHEQGWQYLIFFLLLFSKRGNSNRDPKYDSNHNSNRDSKKKKKKNRLSNLNHRLSFFQRENNHDPNQQFKLPLL